MLFNIEKDPIVYNTIVLLSSQTETFVMKL